MKKILVVDDEEEILNIIKRFLTVLNYEPFVASTWETAMEAFTKDSYDLVILDVHMPGKDGFVVAREMKDINPDQHIFIMTGLDPGEAYQYLKKAGADVTDVIYKPFKMDKMQKMIEEILG